MEEERTSQAHIRHSTPLHARPCMCSGLPLTPAFTFSSPSLFLSVTLSHSFSLPPPLPSPSFSPPFHPPPWSTLQCDKSQPAGGYNFAVNVDVVDPALQAAFANADVIIFTTGSWYRDVSGRGRTAFLGGGKLGLMGTLTVTHTRVLPAAPHTAPPPFHVSLPICCFPLQGPPKSRMYYHGNAPAPGLSDAQAVNTVLRNIQNFRAANKVPGFPIFLTSPAAHTSCRAAAGPWSGKKGQTVWQYDYNARIRNVERGALATGAAFPILDVSYMSLLRPDAHSAQLFAPGAADCTHWCVPGIPDTWLDFMFTSLGL